MSAGTLLEQPLAFDPFFVPLKKLIIERTGLAYYGDRETELMGKIQSRLDARKMRDCQGYFELMNDKTASDDEFDALVAGLTIGETHFFRHREMFNAIREFVLPNVVERNRASRRLRVWSAGCSIGAEAYSASILIREFLGDRADDWDVTILGTDINRQSLARARHGLYDDWALRSLSNQDRTRYFEPRDGKLQISPQFIRQVSFQYHNLVAHPFPSLVHNLVAFDIVLCRNVMIYFSDDINHQVVRGFHEVLVDGGWLLVGHSEPRGDLFCDFKHVLADGAVLYQTSTTANGTDTSLFPHLAVVAEEYERIPNIATIATPAREQADRLADNEDIATEVPSESNREADGVLAEVRVLADRGHLEAAARLCETLLEKRKLCPKVNFHFALLMEQTGRIDEAEQWLRKAIYLDRGYVLAHYYLGLTHLRQRRNAAAAQCFGNTLRLTTDTPPEREFEGTKQLTIGDVRKLAQMHLSLLADK